jgi:HlyD family secretion protein
MKTFLISAGVILAILLIIGGIGTCVVKSGKSSSDAATIVRVENPLKGELVEVVNAPGEIQPKQKVVISARVAARITELPFKIGDRVTMGDPNANPPVPPSVLVRLDSTELEAILRSTESHRAAQEAQIEVEKSRLTGQIANVNGIRTRLDDAERELNRVKQLLGSKVVSQSEVDSAQCKVDDLKSQLVAAESSVEAAKMNLKVLRHNLASAEAEVAKVKDNLSYTTITSPIDGVVTKVNTAVGELAVTGTMNNPGTVILEVADLSKVLLVAQVDESDIGSIQVGQKASAHIQTYPNKVFEGVVESVALTYVYGSARTKVFETKIALNMEGQTVFSGLSADVDIETRRHDGVLTIPSQAVLARRAEELPLDIRTNNPNIDMAKTDATVVYRVKDGKAIVTPVKIGPSDTTRTIILSGVQEGDRIIVGPYKELEKLSHNQRVRDERETLSKKVGKSTTASAPSSGPTSGRAATQSNP